MAATALRCDSAAKASWASRLMPYFSDVYKRQAHVGGLESREDLRYGRDSLFGAYGFRGDTHGFVTSTSWGYRVRGIWEYSNVFAGVNLRPNVSWSHDVDGYGPNGLFNEGAKAVSFGVDADYRNTYTASLSYTDFFGGKYNLSLIHI